MDYRELPSVIFWNGFLSPELVAQCSSVSSQAGALSYYHQEVCSTSAANRSQRVTLEGEYEAITVGLVPGGLDHLVTGVSQICSRQRQTLRGPVTIVSDASIPDATPFVPSTDNTRSL